jgi:hypothetical protein
MAPLRSGAIYQSLGDRSLRVGEAGAAFVDVGGGAGWLRRKSDGTTWTRDLNFQPFGVLTHSSS